MKKIINGTTNLTEEMISDLLCTTFFAINHWAEGIYPSEYGTVKKDEVSHLSSDEAYAKILFNGGKLEIKEIDSEDDENLLDLDKLIYGIEKAIKEYPNCIDRDDLEATDEVGCDVIIQLAIFKEVVYS